MRKKLQKITITHDTVNDTKTNLNGGWSRIPRDKRLCSCGADRAVQTEEHVICFCPMSQHVRSQSEFVAVEFTNIVKFF